MHATPSRVWLHHTYLRITAVAIGMLGCSNLFTRLMHWVQGGMMGGQNTGGGMGSNTGYNQVRVCSAHRSGFHTHKAAECTGSNVSCWTRASRSAAALAESHVSAHLFEIRPAPGSSAACADSAALPHSTIPGHDDWRPGHGRADGRHGHGRRCDTLHKPCLKPLHLMHALCMCKVRCIHVALSQ